MAIGAITQQATGVGGTSGDVVDKRENTGLLMRVINVVGDSSYPTGGTSLTPSQLGFPNGVLFSQTEIVAATGTNSGASSSVLLTSNGGTALNLKCFTSVNTNAAYAANQIQQSEEVPNATNLSGITWQIIAWGW